MRALSVRLTSFVATRRLAVTLAVAGNVGLTIPSCKDREPLDYESACFAECDLSVECKIRTNPDICPIICMRDELPPCDHEITQLNACKASHYDCENYLPGHTADDPCSDERAVSEACMRGRFYDSSTSSESGSTT